MVNYEKLMGIIWVAISTAFMSWMLWQSFKSDPVSGTVILVVMLIMGIGGAAYGLGDPKSNK